MIEKVFLTIGEISFEASLIILPLLLLSSLLEKKYTFKWKYIIWMVIAFRLMIPITLNLPDTPFTIKVPLTNTQPIYIASENVTNTLKTNYNTDNTTNKLEIPTNENLSNSPSNIENLKETTTLNEKTLYFSSKVKDIFTLKNLSIIWLIGVFLYNLYEFTGYFLFRKNMLRWSLPVSDKKILDLLSYHCNEMRISKKIKVMSCKRISTPLVIGLFKPILLIPMDKISYNNLNLILKHELIHIKEHHITYKLLLNIANSIHWFNPIVYLMVNVANSDLEFYCDEEVVKNMDTSYKASYSEAILSVMNLKPSYNAILSTHFNGGIKIMKSRFKNIFDAKKKSKGIISLCLMLSIIIASSAFVGCQGSKNSSSEDTAKSYLNGFYEIDDYAQIDEMEAAFDKASEAAVLPTDGTGIATVPEESFADFRKANLSKINEMITSDFGDTLIANRSIYRNLSTAKEFNYTTEIKDINLIPSSSSEADKAYYTYEVTIVLTYSNKSTEEQILKGSLSLVKEDDKWLVNIMKETQAITPNKEFYSFNQSSSNSLATATENAEFFSAEELCDEYIKALLESNSSFIYANTVNTSKSTTPEELKQTWDSIKITSVKIIDSEVRDNKAYYELEINVSDPGYSAFEVGKNSRWLYLSSNSKGGIIRWDVEGLMSSGKPDDKWWSTVIGG